MIFHFPYIILDMYMSIHGRKMKSLLPAAALSAVIIAFSVSFSRAQWECVRSFIGPGGASIYSVSSFTVSQTIGETMAGQSGGDSPSGAVFSGYLSQIPSDTLALSLLQFESTGALTSEGTLWGMESAGSIKLTFSNELSSSTVSSGIIVTEVMDHSGNAINSISVASVSFTGLDNSAEITPASGEWPSGSLFAVYYSSSFMDINGLPLASGTTRYFTTMMDHLLSNVAAAPGELGTRVNIPAGTYSQDFLLMVSTGQSDPSIATANGKLASLPGGIPQPLKVLSLNARNKAGNAVQPGATCVLKFSYKEAGGKVAGTSPPARAENLAVWRLDESKKMWVKQTGALLDATAKNVSLRVEHFSSYALLAVPDTDVSLAHAYPVPFRPNAGNPAKYGSWNDLITFTQIPSYGEIKIYTITGELVRELDIIPPSMKWDLKNSGGQTVASGVYIWKISSGGNTKTGKLMVIK